ncbi:MAG: peptide chain release factor 2 [Bdellovibrionota bacterium]
MRERVSKYGGFFDVESKKSRLRDLNDSIEANPDFWNNPEDSASVLQEKKLLEKAISRADSMLQMQSDLGAALELAEEGDEFRQEAEDIYVALEKELEALEVQSLLNGEHDQCNALVTINAGAGGTESCDWASMIMRMYLRYVEKQGWGSEIHDLQDGDEAGIKSVTFEVTGEFAFGLLKAESGVHRLVRISPFDANAKRHTSFCSVFVSPVIDDAIEIEINPADLRIDTYRASGAGGQHVNRTDSAVRITHQPSGIVVQSQSQRSQHQNRDTCMKLLRSKLYELELQERRKKQQDVEAGKSDIAFGSQIRSYVLHPYKMVKDHRTKYESHAPEQVLDGAIDEFINSYLTSMVASRQVVQ